MSDALSVLQSVRVRLSSGKFRRVYMQSPAAATVCAATVARAAPTEYKGKVERDVEHHRHGKEHQRNHRVAYRTKQERVEIIYTHGHHSEKDDEQIVVCQLLDLGWCLHDADYGIDENERHGVEHKRCRAYDEY